jgi:hypothetical protein
MAGPTNCELCGDTLDGGHDRVGGLALCRRCWLGDVRSLVAARGWTLWSEHAEYAEELDDSDLRYRTIVRITIAAASDLDLVGERRRWWSALKGLVRRRARSRDPLVESHVRVWTTAPARVEAFLRGDGVEGSVMEVLGNLPTSNVKIRGGALEVRYLADDPHTEGEIVARCCVLAHHLERHAADRPTAAAPTDALPEPRPAPIYGPRGRG